MNLPNRLTLMRIILIPFVMFFYLATFIPNGIGKIVALILFIVASVTDFLDGKIARKYNLVTNLGKFLDPIADKILTTTAFLLVIVDGTIAHPYGVIIVTIIIAREFMVSAMRLIAAGKGKVLAADMFGKTKTLVQMIALPTCFLLAFLKSINGVANAAILTFEVIAYILVIAATILTVLSGGNYLIKNRDCFKDE